MTAQPSPASLPPREFAQLLDTITPAQAREMLTFFAGYSPPGFDAALERARDLADAEASPANPYSGTPLASLRGREHYDAESRPIDYAGPTGRELPGEHWNARIIREQAFAESIANIRQVSTEYPDGVHTCAELQELEPGRRPCTCGRCRIMPPPHRMRTIERPADGAA